MPIRLALVNLLSVALYLSLAILGAGGAAAFFSHPPLLTVVAVTVALAVASLFTKGHIGSGVREDRSNRWVIAALGVLGLLDAYLPAYSDRRDVLTLDGEEVRWVGAVLFALGGVLRLAPVFVLGRRFTGLVAIQPDHRLVTSGLYGVVRQPSYLGLLLGALGWGLAFRAGVGIAIALLMIPVVLARIESEERLLAETFGAEYEAYRARTWRLAPYLY